MTVGRFLKKENLIMTGLQLLNFTIALVVIRDFYNNYGTEHQKNATEYLGDVAIHCFQAALTLNSSTPYKLTALGLNAYRLVDIPLRIATGTATVRTTIAMVDVGNHFLNTTLTTVSFFWKQPKKTKKAEGHELEIVSPKFKNG